MKQNNLSRTVLAIIVTLTLILNTFTKEGAAETFADVNAKFSTNHGELIFVDAQGKLSFDALEVKLNGKSLLKAEPIRELWGDGQQHARQQYLSVATIGKGIIHSSIQEKGRYQPGKGPIKIERLLVAEGKGRDTTKFIILDFTGKEPFVSRRFGSNPGLKHILRLEGVKWGKKKAIVALLGPYDCTYNYTGGRVKCEVDDENE